MSTFTSTGAKAGNAVNYDTLFTSIDSVAAQPQSASAGSYSNNTTTYTTAISKTFTVAADDLVVIRALWNFSISDGNSSKGLARLVYGGSNLIGIEAIFSNSISSATGGEDSRMWTGHVFNLSGSQTFELQVKRYVGSGTIHLSNSYLWFEVLKQRA